LTGYAFAESSLLLSFFFAAVPDRAGGRMEICWPVLSDSQSRP
jgi:hypothetical protein